MGVEPEVQKAAEAADIPELLRQAFPDAVENVVSSSGDQTVVVRARFLRRVLEFLKNDSRLQFEMLADLTAVDRMGQKPRFEVVYNLLSLAHNRRLLIRVCIEADEALESMTPLWGAANWLEREVWDMFGIRFTGHPNLERILLYEAFEGHPLRKDYPLRKRQPLIGPKN